MSILQIIENPEKQALERTSWTGLIIHSGDLDPSVQENFG